MTGKKGGGRRKGAGRKKGDKSNRGRGGKTPEQFMNALVPVGPVVDHTEAEYVEAEPVDADFTKPKPDPIDPVAFCQAVYNGDVFTLQKCGVTETPDLDQRLEAARIAAPYTNKRKPVETISKHQFSWIDEMSEADQRVRNLRKNIENDDAPKSTH